MIFAETEKSASRRTSEMIDDVVGVFSPRKAYQRKAYRFAYDAIDKRRTRKKRIGLGGTGDTQLDERNLSSLREIHLDMMRNNPLVKGLLKTERDGVVGPAITIQARSKDVKYNREVEAAWQEEMVDRPCDVTGRFNINTLIRMSYLGYRRDGDTAIIFLDDKLQAIEGGQIGTPYGGAEKPKNYEIINGIAVSKQNGRVIGYYIGKPNQWGYIQGDSFKKYPAEAVQHIFSPERFSQSRGEPALTASVNFIDTLCDYIDAELVAAKVNACFCMFISQKNADMPNLSTRGTSSTGLDENDNRLEKMEPGTIIYGDSVGGDDAKGIGQVRPGQLFDPFVSRMLTLIGRPLCMPLMLITLDFSGATFMNARIAYQKVQEAWQGEQVNIINPIVSRIWRWFIDLRFAGRDYAHEIISNRWPYVDPWKEAMADEQQLLNGTITRAEICSRQGRDFTDVTDQLDKEETYRATKKVPAKQAGQREIIKE